MPQLDFYAFENQVVYLIIFFFFFVNFFSYFFLPDVFISLKARFSLLRNMEERNLNLQLTEQKLRFSTNSFFDYVTNFSSIYVIFSKLLQSVWNVFFLSYPNINNFFSYSYNIYANNFLNTFLFLPISFIYNNFFLSLSDFFYSFGSK
jgi:hypothetical protein